mmetsp:Transcript_12887/g.14173  ORF Transcript_12887/g.14173 Transcript_12887/m.14173 type:complete len:92 (-) Transcript_12887:83-358(-)
MGEATAKQGVTGGAMLVLGKGPPFVEHVGVHDRDADMVGQVFQLPKDQGAVRPRAGERYIEVIASTLGSKTSAPCWASPPVNGDPVAKLRS